MRGARYYIDPVSAPSYSKRAGHQMKATGPEGKPLERGADRRLGLAWFAAFSLMDLSP